MKTLVKRLLRGMGFEITRLGAYTPVPDPFKVMQALVTSKRPTLFDVGANTGQTAIQFRELFPLADLYCFEPFPNSFSQLTTTLTSDRNAKVFQLALADRSGTASFTVNEFAQTNSLLPTGARAELYWGKGVCDTQSQIDVQTETVDNFCNTHVVSHIDVLKLDVQGAEYAVLKGAMQMLKLQQIDLVYMELITAPTYVGQKQFHEYLSLLDGAGYELFDVYNQKRRAGRLIQADNIFISRRLLTKCEGTQC